MNNETVPPPSQNSGVGGFMLGCGVAVVLLIGACGGGIYFLVSGVFSATAPVVDVSNSFLSKLAEGKYGEAHSMMAADYRSAQDEAAFTAAVKKLGLDQYASASWTGRNVKTLNGVSTEGTVEGTLTTKDGKTKPIAIKAVWEEEKWKPIAVQYGGVELISIRPSVPVPGSEEIEKLVRTTLNDFNTAVQSKDFAPFYATIATLWQKQTTAADLAKVFQAFIDRQIDLKSIDEVKMELTEPAVIDGNGMLVVKGIFPTMRQVTFELKYLHETEGWKLAEINVNVADAN